jgi:heme O synthase-like polyprenyltransferase
VFDPATRRTILISVLLILGVMLTPTLHLVPALIAAAVLPTLGLIWLWLSTKAKQHRDALEAAEAEAAGLDGREAGSEDPGIPSQPSDTHPRG